MILARWHEIRDTMLADTKERERNLAAAVRRARRGLTQKRTSPWALPGWCLRSWRHWIQTWWRAQSSRAIQTIAASTSRTPQADQAISIATDPPNRHMEQRHQGSYRSFGIFQKTIVQRLHSLYTNCARAVALWIQGPKL